MPPARNEIRSRIQLLVEGKDAENFFRKLALRLSLPEVEVQDFGGVDQLRGFLAAFAAAPNFGIVRSIGIGRSGVPEYPRLAGSRQPPGAAASQRVGR